jgi:hypothetical protein
VLPNDDINNATIVTLTGNTFSTSEDIYYASRASDDPVLFNTSDDNQGLKKTVWYQFTPTISGPYIFDTIGTTQFETNLAVLRGNRGALTLMGSAEAGYYPSPKVAAQTGLINLTAGQRYYVEIEEGHHLGTSLIFTLNINYYPGYAGAGKYDDSYPGIVYGDNWYENTMGDNYLYTTHENHHSSSTGSFTFAGESIRVIYPKYPDCNALIVSIDGGAETTIDEYYPEYYLNYPQQEWYSGALSAGIHTLTFRKPTEVNIACLDGFIVESTPSTPTLTPTPIVTSVPTIPPTPTATPAAISLLNDDFDNAATIMSSGNALSIVEDMTNATAASDDPVLPCRTDDGGWNKTVWFKFTPETTGQYIVDTSGTTNFYTDLALWQGTRGMLSSIGCGVGGSGGGMAGQIGLVNLTSGQSYFIEVKQFYPINSPYVFHLNIHKYPGYAETGKYDDTYAGVSYGNFWHLFTTSAFYLHTIHENDDTQDPGSFIFVGTRLKVIYPKWSHCNTLSVSVDGAQPNNIDENDVFSFVDQQQWDSGELTPGTHTLSFWKPAGASVACLDGFIVENTSPTPTQTESPTVTETATPTLTVTPTVTAIPTETLAPSRTETFTSTPSETPTFTETPVFTSTNTATPTETRTSTTAPTLSATPTPTPASMVCPMGGHATGLQFAGYNWTGRSTPTSPLSQYDLEAVFVSPQVDIEDPPPPPPGITVTPQTQWAGRWAGLLYPPVTGPYIFQTISDDGIRLWINDVQVVSHWNDHTVAPDNSPQITFNSCDPVKLVVEYYQDSGPEVAKLSWMYPGTSSFGLIPASAFSPANDFVGYTVTPTIPPPWTPTFTIQPSSTPTRTLTPSPTGTATPVPTPTGTATPVPTA